MHLEIDDCAAKTEMAVNVLETSLVAPFFARPKSRVGLLPNGENVISN